MNSIRQVNKQLERKVEQITQPLKQNPLFIETEKRMQHNEKWAEELEEKLSFTVEKFEEQNQRFMQCGRELADAHE